MKIKFETLDLVKVPAPGIKGTIIGQIVEIRNMAVLVEINGDRVLYARSQLMPTAEQLRLAEFLK